VIKFLIECDNGRSRVHGEVRLLKVTAIARLFRIVTASAFAGALIGICSRIHNVNDTTVALLLVLVIVGIATLWGAVESLLAALIAGIGFDYFFLPPPGLGIQAPEHWVALCAFLATAITTSQISAISKRRRIEAAEQRNEMEKLYTLVNVLLDGGREHATLNRLARELVQILGAGGVALYDEQSGQIARAGPGALLITDQALHKACGVALPTQDRASSLWLAPIRHGGELFGSIGIAGAKLTPSLLEAVTGRIGMGLAKYFALEKAQEAQIARRSQELKSAVLDALAHEIKNPLNSIKIAVTTLRSGESYDPMLSQEMLGIIDQEADRVNRCVDETVKLARVEAESISIEKTPEDLARLIPDALDAMGMLSLHKRIQVSVPDSLPPADCDRGMILHVLKQLVNNAVKYSPDDSPLVVSAEFNGNVIVMNVIDHGPGVPEEDRERIFEKYYRGRAAASGKPGNGLGLASAKCIVQAHGGRIWVTRSPEGGAAFHVSLPVAREAQ